MNKTDEHILRAAKEVAVKFIETGRISPTNFEKAFLDIYGAVKTAVCGNISPDASADDPD
ncbi:MAG: conjugal transfer protein TraB [Deltaproteobacteria bacterium]|nr:MAG: conjugal transfer protein TraB [Deltaproteobacteria bacterium]